MPKRDSFLPNVKRPPRPGSLDIDTGFKKLRGSVKDSEQRLLRIKNGKSLFQEEQSLRPTDESGQSRSQIPLLAKENLQSDYGKLLRAESSIRSLKEMSAPYRIFGSFTPSPGHRELSMEQKQLAQIPTDKLRQLRKDQKNYSNSFSLPLNPALVTPTPGNKEKVLSVDEYCRRKNLGFSPQQQILVKIKDSQNTHKRWSSLVTNLVPQSTELTPVEQMQRLETTREEIHKRAHKHSRLTPISTSQKSGYLTPVKHHSPKRTQRAKEYQPSATAQGRFYSHRAKRDTEPSIPLPHFSSKKQPRIIISDMVLSRLSQTPDTHERVEEVSDEEDKESAMIGGISMRMYEKLKHRVFSTVPVQKANESFDRPRKKRKKSVGAAANVLLGIYKQTNAIIKSKRDNDQKLQKMLKRVELDRPIILRDKIDIMWSREEPGGKTKKISGSTQLRTKLIMKRTERTSRIQDQRNSYVKLLRWLHQRYLETKDLPDEDQRRICEAIRTVLDAGWVITSQDLSEIYRLVNVGEQRVDPQHPARSSKMILFQEEVRNLFNFD